MCTLHNTYDVVPLHFLSGEKALGLVMGGLGTFSLKGLPTMQFYNCGLVSKQVRYVHVNTPQNPE